MEKWALAKRADFQEIGRKYGTDPVIARIIRNRDLEDAINQYLKEPWMTFHPGDLKDIDKAGNYFAKK